MSGHLWKAYLEDDLATFRALLDKSLVQRNTFTRPYGLPGSKHVSPSPSGHAAADHHALSHSFKLPVHQSSASRPDIPPGLVLSKADVNHRDPQGRTLLHLIASSRSESAINWAQALLSNPHTDIYIQDVESRWTPLHRALYEGNMSVAMAILARDSNHPYPCVSYNSHQPIDLIRIKDNEGYGPFDLFEQTYDGYGRTDLISRSTANIDDSDESDDDATLQFAPSMLGQQVYTFGSNKNMTLGFGDEDDRQYPERVALCRPLHLLQRFWLEDKAKTGSCNSLPAPPASDMPFHIRFRPIYIRDIQMSRYSSAIITTDPEFNLHLCGHGARGRLGLGDIRTRYQFTCVTGGHLAHKEVVAIALGHHHTLALSKQGEVFSWGSNAYGQLGYSIPNVSNDEESIQLLPRQIFGLVKREFICGAAASSIHSVLHTTTELFTFGKNEGQLGLVDADAKTRHIIDTPRRVGGHRFSCSIESVSAIDHATICLLSDRQVWVYANYGFTKIVFPSIHVSNPFLRQSFMANKLAFSQNSAHAQIVKVAAAGETIATLTDQGIIFTLDIARTVQDKSASSTNPSKIRSALSTPVRAWANKRSQLQATDVAVDQNGMIILATQSGSVWRRVKRVNIKDATASAKAAHKPKYFKYSRVSYLTTVNNIRASGTGAFAALRNEGHSGVIGQQVHFPVSTWHRDWLAISPFHSFGENASQQVSQRIVDGLKIHRSLDDILNELIDDGVQDSFLTPDLLLETTQSSVVIPLQQFVLAAASAVLNQDLRLKRSTHPNVYEISEEPGRLRLKFKLFELLTLFNLALLCCSGSLMDYVSYVQLPNKLQKPPWHTVIKPELLRLASILQISMDDCIRFGRQRTTPLPGLLSHRNALPGANMMIRLGDGEAKVHAALLARRSPIFKALCSGRSQGRWLEGRLINGELTKVDFVHVKARTFDRFLNYIYTDSQRLFEDVVVDSLDDYLDEVMDLLDLASELMIESLAQICQAIIGGYVNARNVCQILEASATCLVTCLKDFCLRYIFFNLEATMRYGCLDILDKELLSELDELARAIQSESSFISRTGQLEKDLHKRHPQLEDRIAQSRRAKIDCIDMLNKHLDSQLHGPNSFRAGSLAQYQETAVSPKERRRSSNHGSMESPRALRDKASVPDLVFEMDPEAKDVSLYTPAKSIAKPTAEGDVSRYTESSKQDIRTPEGLHKQGTLARRASGHKPWMSSSPLQTSKLSMKDIMAQASSGRTSSLSIGLLTAESPLNGKKCVEIPPSAPKLSQRARKKLLDEQGMRDDSPSPQRLEASPNGKPSPWTRTAKARCRVSEANVSVQSSGPSTPQLTMRQTIANPGLSRHGSDQSPGERDTGYKQGNDALPSPSAATSVTPGKFMAQGGPMQIQPRSVRHMPLPMKPDMSNLQASMTDIQSQQEIEKMTVSGGVGKQRLAEIQAEQEFQEWWDKESARVQAGQESQAERQTRRGRRNQARQASNRQRLNQSAAANK